MEVPRPTRRPAASMAVLTAIACLGLCLEPAGAGARGSCRPRPLTHQLVHHVAPPQGFLSSLSVLRRPQTPADLQGVKPEELREATPPVEVPGMEVAPLANLSVIYVDYIRKLGVGKDAQYLVPARVQTVAPMSRGCLQRLPVKARRQQLALERADRARGVVLLLGDGSFAEFIVTYRELISSYDTFQSGGGGPQKTVVLYGIVPDGVFSVGLLSEKNAAITTQVTENFFSLEVPPSFQHGSVTTIWRDANGHTLKRKQA
jgi:hypothetical protein